MNAPATMPAAGEKSRPRSELPRRIGFWGGCAIMVGIIIGSGIFQKPTEMAREFGSPLVILLFWVAGGLISLAGALSYAELATMFPQSGGIYVFLREAFGRCAAFVFGWTYMLIIKPLAAAGIATIFSTHVNPLLHTNWDPGLMTAVLVIGLTAVNTPGVRLGTGLAGVLTALKVAALLGIAVLGLFVLKGSISNFASVPSPRPLLLAIAPAMQAVLWAYDGWSDIAAVAGEVRSPQRNIPRILVAGTTACILLYVAVNAVYMAIISLEQMRTLETVAPVVMQRLAGSVGETIILLVILISTFGSTHGSILTGARVTFAQARDGLLFSFLGRVHPRFQTPAISLWVQALLTCIAAIFLRDFDRLTDGYVFTMWIFFGMAGVAVIVLRVRRPEAERPYRCWGYPFVPVLFAASALGMTVLTICTSKWPLDSAAWIVVLLAGVPIYFGWERVRQKAGGMREV